MEKKIAEIEAKTGNTVYVGELWGSGSSDIWACVDVPGVARFQNPASTAEEAVDGLYEWVMK